MRITKFYKSCECNNYRLPTGHGHNQGDGVFGLIKQVLRSKPLYTWESFVELLLAKFLNSTLHMEIHNIVILHDWRAFMEECTDGNLGRWAKEEMTQHQWKFEKCANDANFPLNVKVFYRSYAADETVETTILQNEYVLWVCLHC